MTIIHCGCFILHFQANDDTSRTILREPLGGIFFLLKAAHEVSFRCAEEAQQSTSEWPTGPTSESTLNTEDDGCPGVEPSDETTAEMGACDSIHADAVTPTRLQSPQACKEGLRTIKRHGKDTGTYSKEKYHDFELYCRKR